MQLHLLREKLLKLCSLQILVPWLVVLELVKIDFLKKSAIFFLRLTISKTINSISLGKIEQSFLPNPPINFMTSELWDFWYFVELDIGILDAGVLEH